MRFSCDSCLARYTIADEKVQEKALRVRCKRCGNSILLHKQEPEDDELIVPRDNDATHVLATAEVRRSISRQTKPEPPPPPVEGPQWYLAIARAEVGPLTEMEVRHRIASGQVTPRTHVWRDGMPSWTRLKDVPPFAAFLPASDVSPLKLAIEDASRSAGAHAPTAPVAAEAQRDAAATEVADPLFVGAPAELGEKTRAISRDSLRPAKHRPPVALIVLAVLVALVATVVILRRARFAGVAQPVRVGGAGAAASTRTLDISVVSRKVAELKPRLQGCVSAAPMHEPDLHLDAVIIAATIEPDGTVGPISLSRAELATTALGACLKESVQTLRFPGFDGVAQDVSIPLPARGTP